MAPEADEPVRKTLVRTAVVKTGASSEERARS